MTRENISFLEEEAEGMVCPSCAAFIGPNETFCPACRAPVSLLANTDPIQRIQTEGFLYSRAVESRPKVVILVCVWLTFLPIAAISGGWLVILLTDGLGSGGTGFVLFWIMAAACVFSVAMLYRITKNYLKYKPEMRKDVD